ncbi:MAG: DUF4364 family protein [Clostridia bacterium]|nr:DUF4364 family protein [Clostridia bacterium]
MEYANDTQDKLIVLYIISKLNKSITNLQMVDLILDSTGIDYFTLQDLLIRLQNAGLINLFYQNDIRYYKITEEGEQLLDSLMNLVPEFILFRIDGKIEDSKKEVQQKSVVYADFFPDGKGLYQVKCKISEGGEPLVELSISVNSREQAIMICNDWYENPSKYYIDIIKMFN